MTDLSTLMTEDPVAQLGDAVEHLETALPFLVVNDTHGDAQSAAFALIKLKAAYGQLRHADKEGTDGR